MTETPGTRLPGRGLLPALVLVVVLSGPSIAVAQQDLMALDPAQMIEGLSRTDLEGAIPERRLCRRMLGQINDLVEIVNATMERGRREGFVARRRAAESRWPSTRGRCDAAIGDLDEGWPRAVLRGEFRLAQDLWLALQDVANSWEGEQSHEETSGRIALYREVLERWRLWLERSTDFWAGAWLDEERPHTCLRASEDKGREIARRLWTLTTCPSSQRLDEDILDVELRIQAEREALASCDLTEAAEIFERVMQGRILDTYAIALGGLREDDNDTIRRAFDAEQQHASRRARCRMEYAEGAPSEACRP